MRYFAEYCALLNTPPWRTGSWRDDEAVERRESLLLCSFLVWLAKDRVKARARDRDKPLPKSCYNIVLAVRRAHADRGYTMVPAKQIGRTLKHLTTKYAEEHGYDALLPVRKEPFPPSRVPEFRRISTASVVCGRALDWAAPFFIMIWAVICLASSAGFRKAELTVRSGAAFTVRSISRANLVWRFTNGDGTFRDVANPSAARLRALRAGDYALVRPPPSKTDQWGTVFGNQFVFLPFDQSDPANAAAALRDYELAFPLGGRPRSSVPLFSMDPASLDEPLRASTMDAVMAALFRLIMGASRAACFSFHSFRIGVACALLAAGYSHAAIQAHCRWKTDASIQIYARQNAEMFGARVLAASGQGVSSVVVANFLRHDLGLDGDATVAIIDGVAGLNAGADDA